VSIHGLDGVAGAQASLVGWRSLLHLLDADGAEQILRKNALVAQVKVIGFGSGGHVKTQLHGFAAALHRYRNRLVGVQLGAFVDIFPVGIVHRVEVADDVAGLDTGLVRCRTWSHPFDGRGLDFDGGDLVDPAEVEDHQHKSENEVGEGPASRSASAASGDAR
jgi:hypothetical protein